MKMITWQDFENVELRVGTVIHAEPFERARKPAYKIKVNFGPDIGILQTSAQVTVHYTPETLIGKTIVGCVNLGEKNIGGFISQFLLIGALDQNKAVQLATFEGSVPNGSKLC